MKKSTFKIGTNVTFNRISSANDGKTGVVVAHRTKATSPIGVKFEGKSTTVWCDPKFLTVNAPVTTLSGFSVGDSVTYTKTGKRHGQTGTINKFRSTDGAIGVNFTAGLTTWCKPTSIALVNSSSFYPGDVVILDNAKSRRNGMTGTVKQFRADGKVGVNFSGSTITWCNASNLSTPTDTTPAENAISSSVDSVVINFKGINITVAKNCNVSISENGVSVA